MNKALVVFAVLAVIGAQAAKQQQHNVEPTSAINNQEPLVVGSHHQGAQGPAVMVSAYSPVVPQYYANVGQNKPASNKVEGVHSHVEGVEVPASNDQQVTYQPIPEFYKPFGSWGLYIGGQPTDGYYTDYYKKAPAQAVGKSQAGDKPQSSPAQSPSSGPMAAPSSALAGQAPQGEYNPYAYAQGGPAGYASPSAQYAGYAPQAPATMVAAYPVPVGTHIVGSQPGVEGAFYPYGVHAYTKYVVKPVAGGAMDSAAQPAYGPAAVFPVEKASAGQGAYGAPGAASPAGVYKVYYSSYAGGSSYGSPAQAYAGQQAAPAAGYPYGQPAQQPYYASPYYGYNYYGYPMNQLHYSPAGVPMMPPPMSAGGPSSPVSSVVPSSSSASSSGPSSGFDQSGAYQSQFGPVGVKPVSPSSYSADAKPASYSPKAHGENVSE